MLATVAPQSALHKSMAMSMRRAPSVSSMDSEDSSCVSITQGPFVSARIRNQVCLVQTESHSPSSSSSSLPLPSPTDLTPLSVYRHEFGTVFRFSYTTFLRPDEYQVLFAIDDAKMLVEPDTGAAFVSRDVMAHMNRYTMASRAKRAGW